MIVIGIDPGPTYTAVSVSDDEKVILSSTFKRPDDAPIIWWANHVAVNLKNIVDRWPDAIVGIEGVVTPQAYYQGKKNLMNPKHLIHTGIMVGAISHSIPQAVIVRPGNNGSRDNYPDELNGPRPKTLEGTAVGVRKHERSAYDVALQAPGLKREGYILDNKLGEF